LPAKKFRLRIITPALIKVDEDVERVIMRCTTGAMGILAGHETRSAALIAGILRILNNEVERRIVVYGGLAMMENDVLTILTNGTEWPEDIDLARAEAEREQAERRVLEREDDLELKHDQLLLRRALVRIEAGSRAFDSSKGEE